MTGFPRFFLLGFLSWGILVSCSSRKYGDGGFVPTDDPSLPGTMANAQSAVFQIVVLLPGEGSVLRLPEMQARLRETGNSFKEKISRDEISKCFEQARKVCRLSGLSWGTAFLVEDRRTLWTARHILGGEQKKLKNFFLLGPGGKIVWDSRVSGGEARIEYWGNPEGDVTQQVPSLPAQMSQSGFTDFVVLKLSRSLEWNPLQRADRRPVAQEPVFVMGFPASTIGLTSNPNLKTNGNQLLVSKGRVFSAREMFPRKRLREDVYPFFKMVFEKVFETAFVYHSAAVFQGSSGAPLLNDEGKVVGVTTGGLNELLITKTNRSKTSVDGLPAFSEALDAVTWIPRIRREVPSL
jgi:hypothetical protein